LAVNVQTKLTKKQNW